MIPPVSVCHHVSTTGQRSPPMWCQYQTHASGLMGSPTVPSSCSDDRSWRGRVLVAPLHERPDGGGRRVELRDLVALDDVPEPVLVRRVGRALVDHARGGVGQRAEDDVRVTGDPPDVGGAEVDVALGVEVEHEPVRGRHVREVTTGRVHDALGLAGGARGVQQVEQVLAVHRLGGPLGRRGLHDVVPPQVAALGPVDVLAGAAHDDDVLDRGALRRRPRRPPASSALGAPRR